MSGDTTPDTETPSKPLLTLLTSPVDDDAPAPSYCCSGGSCSLA